MIMKAPICEVCKKPCSPAGVRNVHSGEGRLWKCFDCNYEVEDISVLSTSSGLFRIDRISLTFKLGDSIVLIYKTLGESLQKLQINDDDFYVVDVEVDRYSKISYGEMIIIFTVKIKLQHPDKLIS